MNRVYESCGVTGNTAPLYRVRSKQPLEDLQRRGEKAVRYGEFCHQRNIIGFAGRGVMMVEVEFEDGAHAMVPRTILRRVEQ